MRKREEGKSLRLVNNALPYPSADMVFREESEEKEGIIENS